MPKRRSRPHRPEREKRISLLDRIVLGHLRKVSECISEQQGHRDSETLIPRTVESYLSIAGQIAWVGPAAQNAQRLFGVPASFLIAANIYEHGSGDEVPTQMGDRFPGEQHLVEEAKHLATHPKFRSALKLAASPVRYARRLAELGYFDLDELRTVAGYIANYHLFECDWRYSEAPQEVTIEDAAHALSLSFGAVVSKLRSEELDGFPGRDDQPGYVRYSSMKSFEQLALLKEIESTSEKKPRTRGSLTTQRRPRRSKGSRNLVVFPAEPNSLSTPAVQAAR